MAITMKQIAELTGVSIGTVDRALNNRGSINPAVAQRIRTVAKELNYKTNSVAKSLAIRNKKLKIAVVLHIQQNPYFNSVEKGIHEATEDISDFGISIEIYRCRKFVAEDQLLKINQAIDDGATAIILTPIDSPIIANKVKELQEARIPVVFLTNFLDNTSVFASVCCNYVRSGLLAAGLTRFLTGGHGEVLVFTPTFSMLGHRKRINAILSYLSEYCPDLHVKKVVELPGDDFDCYRIVSQSLKETPCNYVIYNGDAHAGIKAIKESPHPIRSIFYDMAEVTLEALQADDISATINQNPEMQGKTAVKLLSDYLTSGVKPENEHILIDCEIILRENIMAIDRFSKNNFVIGEY